MRRLKRLPLAPKQAKYLTRKQLELDDQPQVDASKHWDTARKSKTMRSIDGMLRKMAGPRERCMYCSDSLGSDIDHFRPRRFRKLVFVWENLLLNCTHCGRRKSDQFDERLIDPTRDDPWDHMVFIEQTGELAARWRAGRRDARGEFTTSTKILPLNIEAVSTGRLACAVRLKEMVKAFLESPVPDRTGVNELLSRLTIHDSHGLLDWYLVREGCQTFPFREFLDRHRDEVAKWQYLSPS